MNQKLVSDDVTEFNPLKNVPSRTFNEFYGDSFVSGFIEGEVLNAVILMSKQDKTSTTE